MQEEVKYKKGKGMDVLEKTCLHFLEYKLKSLIRALFSELMYSLVRN